MFGADMHGNEANGGPQKQAALRHPVIEILESRREARSAPGARTDDHTVALVVEGGGMRGACSGGMVAALEQLGLRDAFDAVYGASAGALNATYFLARQAVFGCAIYVEDLPARRFINPYRMALPFRRRPIVDMAYALDHIYHEVKPLDVDAVLTSNIPLHVTATDIATGDLVDFVGAETWPALRLSLLASTRVPFIAGAPVRVGQGDYIDATLSDGVPFRLALSQGASHVLVLRSRRNDQGASMSSAPERWLMAGALRTINPRLLPLLETRQLRSMQAGRELTELTRAPETSPYVCAIEPPRDAPRIHQLSRDGEAARKAINAGHRAVCEVMGVSDTEAKAIEATAK